MEIVSFFNWWHLIEMKQAAHNEIDLLLRKLSRMDGDSSAPPFADSSSEHLDPDELNAYAEKMLPEKARLRYTEHLAECSRCRGIVSDLSVSAGILDQPVAKSSEPNWLKKFLAILFSPPVLRYAGPAFAVLAVVTLTFVVLRRQNTSDLVAQNAEVPSMSQVNQTNATNNNAGTFSDNNISTGTTAPRERAEATPKTVSGEQDADKKTPAAPARSDTKALAKEQSRDEAAAGGAQPAVATAAPAPPEPTAKPVSIKEEGEKAEVAQQKPASTVVNQAADKRREEQSRKLDDVSASRGAAKIQSSETRRSVGGIANMEPGSRENKSKDTEQLRQVGGRRFRRDGNVWIDTAYESSRTVVNVKRGSEQYRALIADEPGIRTIAEQLDGEIIVVWKNQAYRIR